MILALLSLLIFIFSVRQIMLFYNIQITFFGIYIAFYVFMAICVWMFNESTTFDRIQGLVFQINMLNRTATSSHKHLSSEQGTMVFTTDIPESPTVQSIPKTHNSESSLETNTFTGGTNSHSPFYL